MKKNLKIFEILALPAWIFLMLAAAYCELLLHFWTLDSFSLARLVQVLLFAGAFGALLGFVASLFPKKAGKWVAVFFAVILAVVYLVEYFVHDAFQVFFAVQTMLAGAGGVAGTFMDTVLSLLKNSMWRIGLMLLPALLYAVFCKQISADGKKKAVPALVTVLLYGLSFGTVYAVGIDVPGLRQTYSFDNAVRCYGVPFSLVLDVVNLANNDEMDFVIPEEPTTVPTEEAEETEVVETTVPEETVPAETEPVYEPHTLGLDFGELAKKRANSNVVAMNKYLDTLTPAMENAYTGLFQGKNLVFITAEAFTGEFIDPELTPTLYRLSTQGVHFTDYYQPCWGAGTIGGEFSNVVGLMPANGGSMHVATRQKLFLTIGNQLQKQGYYSMAFHNNDYTYYSRHLIHPHLGYETYMGYGNGLEKGLTLCWPESDLEMIDYTVPMYIDHQPFSVYYMSVSGHSNYTQKANAMTRKNYHLVEHLEWSEPIKCYIAAQLELENALTSLMNQLEEAGILEDTVIVVASDHYPYGLEKSAVWESKSNFLPEYFGTNDVNAFVRDQNTLIIWSSCLEDMDLVVDTPVMSLDILPTLSNLFGVEYDSRLLPGRDALGEETPLVFWPNHSWITDKGVYNVSKRAFTPNEGVEVDEEYVASINAMVKNKIMFSQSVVNFNYYSFVAQALEEKAAQEAAAAETQPATEVTAAGE